MKVIICGAGRVGYGIAERLSSEDVDVSIIDSDPDLVQQVSNSLNVRGFVGHGAFPDALDRAGADEADMIIAVTLFDEVNMVICQIAHTLFRVPMKIARIRAQSYLAPQYQELFSHDHLPIDVTISPEMAVGDMILKRLKLPGSFETAIFADGAVTMIGVHCGEQCPLLDTPLRQLTELFPDLMARITGISRGGHLFVPDADDQLLAGDEVYVIVRSDHVHRTLKAFGEDRPPPKRIVIAGGGQIGLYVAQKLEELHTNTRLKIIELDRERAIHVAEELNRTVVLNGSALDEEVLREADAPNADVILSLTDDDQVNILSSVLADRLGCKQNLALLNNRSFMSIVPSLGIDAYVNPQAITISHILQYVRRGRVVHVHTVKNGEAEVIEAEALDTSSIVGTPIRALDLEGGVRIGAIVRKGETIPVTGDTEVKVGDRVIVFAMEENVHDVEQLFRVSLEYF